MTQTAPSTAQRTTDVMEALALTSLILAAMIGTISGGAMLPGGTLGLRIGVILSLTLWLLAGTIRGRLMLPGWPVLASLALYTTWVVVSGMQSPYQYGSLDAGSMWITYGIGLLLAASLIRGSRQLFWAALAFCLTALAHGAYGIAQFFDYRFTVSNEIGELTSTYYNPNHYAGFLDLATPTVFALCLTVRNIWARITLILLLGMLATNQILNSSYGGKLAVLVTLVLVLAYHWWRQRRYKLLFGTALTVFVLMSVGAYGAQRILPERINAAQTKLSEEFRWIIGLRLEIYKSNLKVIASSPVYGVGPGNYTRGFTPYRTPKNEGYGRNTHLLVNYAHSDALQITSELGWPGLACTLLVLFACFGRSSARWPAAAGLTALLLHGLIDGNFSHIHGNAFLGWVFLGVLAAGQHAVSKPSPSSPASMHS